MKTKLYPLTTEQFNALRTRLLGMGISIPNGSDGEISHSGLTLKYSYSGSALTLTISNKPWIVSERMIWDKVDQWLADRATV